jgi:eukaryotic-like serine/threonine-protein kinase
LNSDARTRLSPTRCPTCGADIVSDRLNGLCPSCLWAGLDEIEEATPSSGSAKGETTRSLISIPGYVVMEEVARGGMGIVYRARQLRPEREVAIKMLLTHQLASSEMRERFRLEARAISALEHDAILPVYEVGEHDGMPFFTMKFAGGGTLASRRASYHGDYRRMAELLAHLAEATQFAHAHGVLHRDLKPGNILFSDNGRAYVSDFGLAKLMDAADSAVTRSHSTGGTPHYLAPEVAAGTLRDATIACDVYGLGAILYELLAGRPPFVGDNLQQLWRRIVEEEPLPPSAVAQTAKLPGRVPRDLEVICLKCLAKSPAQRYASARELAEDLRRWLAGEPIRARPATRLDRVRSWMRRNPALAVLGVTLAGVLIAAVLLQFRANQQLHRALAESLLAQARFQRASGTGGQQLGTLELVRRAAREVPRLPDTTRAALRTEVAGALALPDLRPVARWPVTISHLENEFDFTADLSRYVVADAAGGAVVMATDGNRPLHRIAGATNNPAVELRMSPRGDWVALRRQSGAAELHAVDGSVPAKTWAGSSITFAFAPSNDRFAVCIPHTNGGFRIEVWNLWSNAVAMSIAMPLPASALAFNPEGTLLAAASEKLQVWYLHGPRSLFTLPLTHQASALAWAPDSSRLAAALDRRLPTGQESLERYPLLLVNVTTDGEARLLETTSERIERLVFQPRGEALLAAGWGGELLWRSLAADQARFTLDGAQRALVFSEDGGRIGYSPSRHELGILDVASPAAFRVSGPATGPTREVYTAAVSRDGRWMATGTDQRVHLWNAQTLEEVDTLTLPGPHWWMVTLFAPNDDAIYFSSHGFGVRRVALRKTQIKGQTLLRFGEQTLLGGPRDFTAIGFASDGKSLIVGQNHRRSANERIPPTVWLWPDADPNRARKLAENFSLVGYRAVPGGKLGVSTDLISPDLWVWDWERAERVRPLNIPHPVSSEPCANGQWLITRSRQEFAVWDVRTWEPVAKWPARADEPGPAAFVASPDSRLLASKAGNNRLILRALPSGRELCDLPMPPALQLGDWQFSPDSQRLFVLLKTGEVAVWDLGALRSALRELRLDWED